MDIQAKVSHLIKKYGTRNPFEIAEASGIIVMYEELGTINGYYNKNFRIKQIQINHNLNEHLRFFTCAHELGHSIIHPDSNTPFLKASTLFSTNKLEIEAHSFAMEMLVSNESLEENIGLTVGQLSRLFGYDKALMEIRLKSFKVN